MAGLAGKLARLAASPQGKRAVARVRQEAAKPENRDRLRQLSQRAQAAAGSARTAYREGRAEPTGRADDGTPSATPSAAPPAPQSLPAAPDRRPGA